MTKRKILLALSVIIPGVFFSHAQESLRSVDPNDVWKFATKANELGPPEKKGVVRVKACDGGWLLEPSGANKTRATYSIYTDSGGAIPAFIVNRASQIGIGRLFAAVRNQVKNPKYSGAVKAN